PQTRPALLPRTAALHPLPNNSHARQAYAEDGAAFCVRFSLPDEHRELLCAGRFPAIVALGVHPLVPFLARLALEREGLMPAASH
ncbi:MAG: hypothetical protein ACK5X5_10910, partial [bacterium]